MRDFCDLINECHYLSLEDFRVLSKVADIAEAKHCISSLALSHRVQLSFTGHVMRNNSRAGLTKAQREQVSDLGDGGFKQDSLKVV